MINKKKILITGGAGYIGSMLSTKLLEEGCFVTVIDKLNYDPDSLNHLYLNNNFHFINEDINKNNFLKRLNLYDIIIPLA